MTFPKISIIIPTFNSDNTLKECLESIFVQNYPKENLEIILVDGGSNDSTLTIINNFKNTNTIKINICYNPLETGEAGKAIGYRNAKNEIIALIDSDNILPTNDWLKRMVEPFEDIEIIASEPIEFAHRKKDNYITRYCSLIGMNDPLCLFLGNYDRYSALTGKWTDLPHKEENKGNYLKISLDKMYIPTIGANGFLIRHSILEKCNIGEYLFDIDIIYELFSLRNFIKIAKVKIGIIHIFSVKIKEFAKKQRRRIKDYLYYNRLSIRKYPWNKVNKLKLVKFILYCLAVIPLLIQSLKGYIKKHDKAWFFHPLACLITFWEYSSTLVIAAFINSKLDRSKWRN